MPYETIIIETPDNEKLHGYLIKQMNQSNERETLVFFHGNAGNIGHRYELYEKNNFSHLRPIYNIENVSRGILRHSDIYDFSFSKDKRDNYICEMRTADILK